jgi:hypothetical protein
LAAQHRAVIEPRLCALRAGLGEHALADFSFSNLLLFRGAHQWRYHAGDWPGLSGFAYDGQAHFFPLFDLCRSPAAVLVSLLQRFGCLFPVAGCHVPESLPAGATLTALRSEADYLYPLENFLFYRGTRLRRKRHQMTQLLTRHRLRGLPLSADRSGAALAVLDQWLRDKAKFAGEADDAPCRQALAEPHALGLEGWLYLADDEPAGFVLAEPLQGGTWVVRFAKGLARFDGIYPAMFHELARQLESRARWLNFEQDLGVPGFRQSKLSYQPAALLPKYRLHLRCEA